MKTRYPIYILLAFLHLFIVSCDDSDEELKDLIPEIEVSKITTDKDEIMLEIGQTATVNITDGGGEYTVYSSDESITEVALNGTAITVTSKEIGIVDVVIADQHDALQKFTIINFIGETGFDRTDFNFGMKLGHNTQFQFKITQGNSGYLVSTEDHELIDVSNNGSDVVLTAKKEGTASFKVTDLLGLETIVPVTITTTTVPFTDIELEAIKANDENRYFINGADTKSNWYTYDYLNTIEDEMNLYGWSYNYGHMKLYFSGDKSVGVKENSRLVSKLSYWGDKTENEITFEIIKNDGTKIWATFSYIEDEKLKWGHFCHNITSE